MKRATIVFKGGATVEVVLKDVWVIQDAEGNPAEIAWEGNGDQLVYLDINEVAAVILHSDS